MNDVAGHGSASGSPQQAAGQIADLPVEAGAVSRDVVFSGHIWDIVREGFTLPDHEGVISRDFMEHPGAVGVVAMDDQGRVLLQRQRRQPVRRELWEVPAGLLDVEGEAGLTGAQRELYEEADLTAATWNVLVDLFNSPGSSSEAIRVYLARDLSVVPEELRHHRTEEEAGMPAVWLSLDEALDAVLSGRVGNPTTVAGVLALAANVSTGFSRLRPADAPWDARPAAGGPGEAFVVPGTEDPFG